MTTSKPLGTPRSTDFWTAWGQDYAGRCSSALLTANGLSSWINAGSTRRDAEIAALTVGNVDDDLTLADITRDMNRGLAGLQDAVARINTPDPMARMAIPRTA